MCARVCALLYLMQPIYDPNDDSLASVTYSMQAMLHNPDCFRPTLLGYMFLQLLAVNNTNGFLVYLNLKPY